MNNKTMWIATILLVALFVLVGCGGRTIANTSIVDDKTCDTKYALQDVTGQRCVTSAELDLFNKAAADVINGTGASQGSEPTATPDASTASTSSGACMTYQQIQAVDKDPYVLIDALNAQPSKTHHEAGGWDAKKGDVIWTGLYYAGNDITLGGALTPISVDGQTGVYWVEQDITIESPGASTSCVVNLSKVAPQIATSTGCIEPATVLGVINAFKGKEVLFNRVDELVDMNPPIQIGSGFPGEVPAGAANTRLVWTRSGTLTGDTEEISSAGGKTLYLLTSDKVAQAGHAWRGLVACSAIKQ